MSIKNKTLKDKYTYLKTSDYGFSIFKNNKTFGQVTTEEEAKYLSHTLEHFDDLTFSCSPTNLVLYLDGRLIGELKVNQMLAELITAKMSTIFKTAPKEKGIDMSDIGWEYERLDI